MSENNGHSSEPAVTTDDVIDAMRSLQSEHDRWNLAEQLAKLIPSGSSGFAELIDQAVTEKVEGGLSATTLRLYRDTANRWTPDLRVANVSFSAHREAMVLDSIPQAAKMLKDLSSNLGPGKVTVQSVRKAIAVKNGKTVPAANGSKAAAAPAKKMADLRDDIKGGAKELIAAIGADTPSAELDELHAGLTKVMAHVERLRAKAARKATTKAPATASSSKAAPTKRASTRKAAGDLRGL